jgi:SnoaL-like polyketide cyclase
MSTQADNKRLMRRFTEEFWNRGNIAFADEIVAEDLIHDQLPPDWPQGREGFKRLVQTWRVAFPDLHEHLEFGWPRAIARWAGSG